MRFLIPFLVIAAFSLEAAACTIMPSTQQKFEKSDVVFSGTVTEIECNNKQGKIKLIPDRIWKGKQASQYVIYTRCSETWPERDKQYLIFAKQDSDKNLRPVIPYCPGSIQLVQSRWKEWWEQQREYFKVIKMPFWSFRPIISVNNDLEKLGQPNSSKR